MICDTVSQQDFPASCTDGADGAIVAWEDLRHGSGYVIYAQHINSKGFVTWKKNGIRVCTPVQSNVNQRIPSIASDGTGGAYVVWQDTRYQSRFGTSLFGQHIRADGTLVYPDSGLPLGVAGAANNTNQTNQVIVEDGRGNAFVAWEDSRNSSVSSRPDIYFNKMYPGGVKFGVTSGVKAEIRKPFGQPTYFWDPNAHFRKWMLGAFIMIGTKRYTISGVNSDTTLDLTPTPGTAATNLNYYVEGLCGQTLDTTKSKQTAPAICKDGAGGCYISWTSSASSPTSVYAQHLDSACNELWNPSPAPGFKVFRSSDPAGLPKNVSLSLDKNELLLAFEVGNTDASVKEDVYADRIRCNTPTDTTHLWGNAIAVTEGYLGDQTRPLIFSDDSTVNGVRGALVPFITAALSDQTNTDVAMIRVLGDGGNHLPSGAGNMWNFERQPNQQGNNLVGLKAVRVYDTTEAGGQRNGVLSVWRDSRYSGLTGQDVPADTVLYTQRIDRTGRKYFDSIGVMKIGTSNAKGIAVCAGKWQAKQISLTPRSDGAIAVWTDFRKGQSDPSIYAQLIKNDGSFTLPKDTSAKATSGPKAALVSRTGSFDASDCNARHIVINAIDTGLGHTGFDSIKTLTATNITVTIATFQPGADTVKITASVVDSLLPGYASIRLVDKVGNVATTGVDYCPLSDTLAPSVTVDSGANGLTLHFKDNRPWDRGLRGIDTLISSNVRFTPDLSTVTPGSHTFDVVMSAIDPFADAQVLIQVRDTVGNLNTLTTPFFIKAQPQGGVENSVSKEIHLSIFPVPASGMATIRVDGAPRAAVYVLDVLGRQVDAFNVESSYEWMPRMLAPGTYIVRAQVGNTLLTKQIVLQ